MSHFTVKDLYDRAQKGFDAALNAMCDTTRPLVLMHFQCFNYFVHHLSVFGHWKDCRCPHVSAGNLIMLYQGLELNQALDSVWSDNHWTTELTLINESLSGIILALSPVLKQNNKNYWAGHNRTQVNSWHKKYSLPQWCEGFCKSSTTKMTKLSTNPLKRPEPTIN